MKLKIEPFEQPIEILVEVILNPSEDIKKVQKAVFNLFKAEPIPNNNDITKLTLKTSDPNSLNTIYDQLRIRKSIAVARRQLLKNIINDSSTLFLNKQTAFVGVLNICEEENESPLGPIKLMVKSTDIRKFIDWISPK